MGTLLLVTYLVTHFIRPPNFCFASLFWFLQRYKRGSLVLFSLIAVVLLASTIIIFLKLHRNASIDPIERVAASRMVFYLSLGFISAVSSPWPSSRADVMAHISLGVGHPLLSRHQLLHETRIESDGPPAFHGRLRRGKYFRFNDRRSPPIPTVYNLGDNWPSREELEGRGQ